MRFFSSDAVLASSSGIEVEDERPWDGRSGDQEVVRGEVDGDEIPFVVGADGAVEEEEGVRCGGVEGFEEEFLGW
jgi:hypothetical protein